MNIPEHNPYEQLTSEQQVAIDLRLSGATYQQIASSPLVNVKEHTLRTWFMEGGICREGYEWKRNVRKEEREEYFKTLTEQINYLAMKAIFTLHKTVENGNVNASFKVLELAQVGKIVQSGQDERLEEAISEIGQFIQARRDEARLARQKSETSQDYTI